MKRIILPVLAVLLIGCTAVEQTQETEITSLPQSEGQPPETRIIPLPQREDLPVKLYYQQYYESGGSTETEDPEVIQVLLEQNAALECGEESNYAVEDYTDSLIFQYADGSTLRYEFEEKNYVTEDGKRYRVAEGLGGLRRLLNDLMKE